MQKRHTDRKQYFEEQAQTTAKYVIPYISSVKEITKNLRVLEIGCGEGGNLIPFIEKECECIGVDLNDGKIQKGIKFISENYPASNCQLIKEDIYNVNKNEIGTFDIIIMRDVIEHIHNQSRFIEHLKNFLSNDAIIFFGYPPWQMPFGGHQQIIPNKLLSKLPYYHLLPKFAYKAILRIFRVKPSTIDSLIEIKDTGISTGRFKRIVNKGGLNIVKNTFYFINPNYQIKFGLKPRILSPFVSWLPYFIRDFFTTCNYCIIQIKS